MSAEYLVVAVNPLPATRETQMAKRLIKLKYCRVATAIGTVATAIAVVGAGHKWH
jgi:hypothetical protein